MWCLETQSLAPGVIKAAVLAGNARLTFSQVISLWCNDEMFVAEWVSQLAAIPFDAYCWETPPLSKPVLGKSFECVFVESPALAKLEPDSQGLEDRLADTPLWLSTAGLGVSWLHVRLDTRPKYYRHRVYASTQYWTGRSYAK